MPAVAQVACSTVKGLFVASQLCTWSLEFKSLGGGGGGGGVQLLYTGRVRCPILFAMEHFELSLFLSSDLV